MTFHYDGTVVVTGARGYIGHRVCSYLADHGNVLGIDDCSDPTAPWPECPTREVDCEAVGVDTLPEATKTIVHLAGISDPDACTDRPQDAWRRNTDTTIHMAALAAEVDAHLVFASTVALSDRPDGTYTATKQAGEVGIRQIRPAAGATIVRCPNVHGTYDVDGEVISKGTVVDFFRSRARSGEPLPVHAPGTQTRTFVDLEEVVQYYAHAAIEPHDDGVETVGIPGEEQSILHLAGEIAHEHGVPIEVVDE